MRRTVLAGVVLAMLWAGGCAKAPTASVVSPGRAAPASVATAPVKTKNDCAQFSQDIRAGNGDGRAIGGMLPADAKPVALLECVTAEQDVAGQGQWLVVNTVRSTGSVDGFVSALRAGYVRPPQPTPSSVACDAVGYAQPWVVLIDADGTAYQIAIPFWGECPAPDQRVLKALAAVKTKVASTERIQQSLSEGAQKSGCDQQFAEMAFVGAQEPGSTKTSPFFTVPSAPASLRVCYYKLDAAYDKGKPAGDFDAAATLTGSQAALVYDGLLGAAVVTGETCDTPASEYAVLFTGAGGGSWSVVELGGCKLATPDSGPDRQVPASVLQALLAAKE